MKNNNIQISLLISQAKALAYAYHKAIKQSGVSDNEFWIWYTLLTTNETHSQQDICQFSGMPKQTVNNIVTAMVQKGYITLVPVPGTKNRKNICLTEIGKAYGDRVISQIWEAENRAYEKMSDSDKIVLAGILGKYVDVFIEELEEITDF